MPATTLDPHTALIVVDLQQGTVGFPTVHPVHEIIAHAVALLDAFRRRSLPVVLVNVDNAPPGRTETPRRNLAAFPAGWTTLIPEIIQQPPVAGREDILITKQTAGAFRNTALEASLRVLGVTQVVLAGISTSAGVESTARQAHEAGFNVTLATDAMTDMNADVHHNSITRIFPKLGETASTAEILDLLDTTHPR